MKLLEIEPNLAEAFHLLGVSFADSAKLIDNYPELEYKKIELYNKAIEYYKSKSGIVLFEKSDVSDVLLTNIKSINDDDVRFIVVFNNLKVLSLENTSISSDGLIYLKNLKFVTNLLYSLFTVLFLIIFSLFLITVT